jgi:phosphate/sulfate permease
MLDLLTEAWRTNKIKVLLIAIPLLLMLLAAVFFKAYRSWLAASAKRLIEKTLGKDKQLSKEADKADTEADMHKANADDLKKKADAVDGQDDPDWNKKI